MITFNIRYFILAVVLFITEVLIALYIHDDFIRPYFGDFLVVVLLYYIVKTFIKASAIKVAICVLVFSYTIEMLQYFKIVNLLGLQKSQLAVTVIGTSFSWHDMLAYTLGIVVVLIFEKLIINSRYSLKQNL